MNSLFKKILLCNFIFMICLFFKVDAYASADNSSEEDMISAELIDLETLWDENDSEISFFSVENNIVDLKLGNHERWIDRMELPDYALKFYETMEEYCDNDGINDMLIEDYAYSKQNATTIKFSSGSDTFHAIECLKTQNITKMEKNFIFKALYAAYRAFERDHPEVFWLDTAALGYGVTRGNEYTYYFMLKMHEGSQTSTFDIRHEMYQSNGSIKRDIVRRDYAVDEILNTFDIKYAANDYEAVKAINDWLIKNNGYNTDDDGDYGTLPHECISALLGNYGLEGPVCEGYASAFKVLCDKLNIACVYSRGRTYHGPYEDLGRHGWNAVRINGVWYYTDVTWNDPYVADAAGPISGKEHEKYLLVGNDTEIYGEKFKDTHILENQITESGFSLINQPIIADDAYEVKFVNKNINSNDVIRIYGSNRYATSLQIAENYRKIMNTEKLGTIIIASGKNYADALAGSYLAGQTDAPILLTNSSDVSDIKSFVIKNLAKGGTIYLLGGNGAVSELVEYSLYGFGNIQRLAGKTRYETNLEILKEAGVGKKDILVCTGRSFADSLSASAANKPIFLVGKSLSAAQEDFLNDLSGNRFYIIGGNGAVNNQIASNLWNYGVVERISGATRYETSVLFAEKFFDNPKQAVFAYGKNFPDGLCGSALAISMDVPMIITATNKEEFAMNYVRSNQITSGFVLGGNSLISDDTIGKLCGKIPVLN